MDKTNVDTQITLSANSSTAANLWGPLCQEEGGDYCHLINLIKHPVLILTKEEQSEPCLSLCYSTFL